MHDLGLITPFSENDLLNLPMECSKHTATWDILPYYCQYDIHWQYQIIYRQWQLLDSNQFQKVVRVLFDIFSERVYHSRPNSIWLVVGPPIWKIWKSVGMMIPNIWENQSHVPVTTNQPLWCPLFSHSLHRRSICQETHQNARRFPEKWSANSSKALGLAKHEAGGVHCGHPHITVIDR